jgi:hypothetical protein
MPETVASSPLEILASVPALGLSTPAETAEVVRMDRDGLKDYGLFGTRRGTARRTRPCVSNEKRGRK